MKEISTEKIYENDNFISFKDANPKSKDHSLVVSKKHVKTVLDLPSSLGNELIDCIKHTTIKLVEENDFEGFNIIQNNFEIAGQVVDHLHFHIVPRYKDDGIVVLS